MKVPQYLMVPTDQGPKRVKVLVSRVVEIEGQSLAFVLHADLKDPDLMMVTEASTGYALGLLTGAWDTRRKLSDRYTRKDLVALCQQKVEHHRAKHSDARILAVIQSKTVVNRLSA